jgi:hypothetical protein
MIREEIAYLVCRLPARCRTILLQRGPQRLGPNNNPVKLGVTEAFTVTHVCRRYLAATG